MWSYTNWKWKCVSAGVAWQSKGEIRGLGPGQSWEARGSEQEKTFSGRRAAGWGTDGRKEMVYWPLRQNFVLLGGSARTHACEGMTCQRLLHLLLSWVAMTTRTSSFISFLYAFLSPPFISIPPPSSPSLHLTLTYINLFFVWTQKHSEVECTEVSLKMWYQASSLFSPSHTSPHSKCLLAGCQCFYSADKIKRIQEAFRKPTCERNLLSMWRA